MKKYYCVLALSKKIAVDGVHVPLEEGSYYFPVYDTYEKAHEHSLGRHEILEFETKETE